MRWRRCGIYSGCIILLLHLAGTTGHAALSLRPTLYLRLDTTDNLHLTEDNRIRENIATIAPGIRLAEQGKRLNLELGYTYEMYRYLREPSLNDRSDAHLGRLTGTLLPESDFNVGLLGEARLEAVDRRRSDTVDAQTVNTTSRYQGQVRPAYRLRLGTRNEAEAAYIFEVIRYGSTLGDDTQAQKAELSVTRRQTARFDLRLTGFYEQFLASINPDYNRWQAMGGGEWRPRPAFTVSALAGNAWFEYETGKDLDSRLLDLRLRFAPARNFALHASYVETFDYDVKDGLYQTWRGETGLSLSGPLSWRVIVYRRQNDYSQVIRKDREQGATGEASYQLTPKVVVGLRGEQRWLEFEPISEKIERASIGASLDYTPHPLVVLGCHYTYRTNNSDIAGNDYIENRGGCDIRLGYDLIP